MGFWLFWAIYLEFPYPHFNLEFIFFVNDPALCFNKVEIYLLFFFNVATSHGSSFILLGSSDTDMLYILQELFLFIFVTIIKLSAATIN